MTSQLGFDQTSLDTRITTVSPYGSRGLPDTTNATDSVYRSSTTLSLMQTASGGQSATINVQVAAS